MEYHPEEKHKYIDLSYEEVSLDRQVADGAWSNGLHTFRFSVAPTGGSCIIPNMSYLLYEYNFGSADAKSNEYTATKPLLQSQKIALQNNWVSCLYNSCRYTVAQSEIGVVNSNHAQLHTLKQRLGRTTSFIEHLGSDMNAFDPDFSRRLARSCSDGVYHRDGLIDCSPYNSPPLSSSIYKQAVLFSQAQTVLTKTATVFNGTALYGNTTIPLAGNYLFLFSGRDGVGDIAFGANGATAVNSFLWYLGANSQVPSGNAVNDALIVDANHINPGDRIVFFGAGATAFDAYECTVFSKKTNGADAILVMNLPSAGSTIGVMTVALGNANGLKAGTGISSIKSVGGSAYAQPDPRSGVVNGMVVYQPPLSFFDIRDPAVFFGDVEIQMTPNSNWQQACIESAVPGTYYSSDVKHGVDYAFGIKSVRLYLARARLMTPPPERALLTLPDYQISNKQLPNGSSTINFNIPPSTNKIAVWIADSAVGSNTKLPLTRFKTRQYITSGDNLTNPNKYGLWANTFDEKLQQIQLNFAGITKPITNFQRGGLPGTAGQATTVSMLQRWIMTNQYNNDRQEPEKFNDWLSMGAYYLFDFERSADNNGTYLTINITYNGDVPMDGANSVSTTPSNVNIYVCSIYERAIALTYNQYGNVVSAQTQMR